MDVVGDASGVARDPYLRVHDSRGRYLVLGFARFKKPCWWLVIMMAGTVGIASAAESSSRRSKLVKSLTGRNETVRLRALASVRVPSMTRAVLDDLILAAREMVSDVEPDEVVRASTVSLLYLIASTDDPRAESLLVDLLDSPHLGVAMVCADALGQNKYYDAIESLKKQVDRPEYATNYGFRFNLVRALAEMQHPDAVEFLTELQPKFDGQLRFQIDRLLDEVTINHFHGDQPRFEAWQKNRQLPKREVIFSEAAFQPESLNRIRFQPQQYYGIDIHAKRMMFIIDHSGSMRKYWGGMSRLDRVKAELTKAIRELPADAEFGIIFYHTNVRTWREHLVMATEDNKREAIQFIRRLGYGTKTNTYGALRRAMEFDDALEAVFLLTDGRPTEGRIIAPAGIVNDILHRNRFRHLNFNTIGVAVSGVTEAFLKRLAEESNGEYRRAGEDRVD